MIELNLSKPKITTNSNSGGIIFLEKNDSKDSKGSYSYKEGVKLNKKSNKSSHFNEEDIAKLFIKYNIFK